MLQGQPKPPKYKVGDVVHLVHNETGNDRISGRQRSSVGGTSARPTPILPQHSSVITAGSSNISASTPYRVSALHTSSIDRQPHQYELTPLEPLKITITEANMIPALLLPGDIVTPIARGAVNTAYYKVKAVTIDEEAALLTSKIGDGASPTRPAQDDGEYEMLENPFAGGFQATRCREAAGTNFGGTQRTSVGKAAPEERIRVVLSLEDACGTNVEMDAKQVRKVPLEEEWKFGQLEKFMGQ